MVAMDGLEFDAFIFDMDGVITKTAQLHNRAWKQMFDAFLADYSRKTGVPQGEFSTQDYLRYVDGKPRYEGVGSFLRSRNIQLPMGDVSDQPGDTTICELGNRKNQLFNQMVAEGLVEVFESTIEFIHTLKDLNVALAVASSSKNTRAVLQGVGVFHLFDVCMDGISSVELGLRGKPEPDLFLEAASMLGVSPYRTVVVEDANVGVSAAARGGFGLVVGVARSGNQRALQNHGADMVVEDIADIDLSVVKRWFREDLANDAWSISFSGYSPELEGTREALLTVGNGYCGTRGAMDECRPDAHHYPGTYVAGVYNALTSEVNGHSVRNEDLVNLPNWHAIQVKIDDGVWLNTTSATVLDLDRKLDFRNGELTQRAMLQDDEGRITLIASRRISSMADPHLLAQECSITPVNYSGTIFVRACLDGDVINWGVERYRQLRSEHLEVVEQGANQNLMNLEMITTQSRIRVTFVADVSISGGDHSFSIELSSGTSPGKVYLEGKIDARESQTIILEKKVSLYTSRESHEPQSAAKNSIANAGQYSKIVDESAMAWGKLWDSMDIQIEGDRLAQKLIRLGLYHLLIACSPHNKDLDVGIPARGLTGESYRGHIFWDELFILMVHNLHFPETVHEVLMYRHRRLDAARASARALGLKGALFPWQSGSDGSEQSQVVHLNPLSGEWGPDYSSLQRHVSLAIAYNIWQYAANHDDDFLSSAGAEMFFEICRFWRSLAVWNEKSGRFDIPGVMGPDEYHESYPEAVEGGVSNNSYSNIMVQWLLKKGVEIFAVLSDQKRRKIQNRINLLPSEVDEWDFLRRKLTISIKKGSILEQFEGYMDLEELDWDGLRTRYGNLHRVDRILKAEGKSPDFYQVTKQADALMTFFNLSEREVIELMHESNHMVGDDVLEQTFDYYLPRTSHGSTLSPVVHAYLAFLLRRDDLAYELFREALFSDYFDTQGKTTAEGVHLGVMAGSAMMCLRAYAGVDTTDRLLKLNPRLPEHWKEMAFKLDHRGAQYSFIIAVGTIRIRMISEENDDRDLKIQEQLIRMEPGRWTEVKLRSGVS